MNLPNGSANMKRLKKHLSDVFSISQRNTHANPLFLTLDDSLSCVGDSGSK